MPWRVFRLDEVANVVAGNPAPQDPTDFVEGGRLFIRMQDVGREHRTANIRISTDRVSTETVAKYRLRLFPSGSVLIPKSGASVNLNHRAMLGCDAYVVSHLAVVMPNRERLLPEYLYYWSLSYDPRNQAQTTSLPSLPLSLIKAASIPIPPLPEQRRIVDLLSRAEGIVRLRREAEKKAAELIPALFLDMFGDPATNPMGWPVVSIGQIATYTRYGPRFPDRQYSDDGAHILRTTDMGYSGELRWYDSPMLPMSNAELEKYALHPGTLLITRTGATIGKTALFNGSDRPCIAGAYLIEVGLCSDVAPEYVLHCFLGQYGQSRLVSGSRAVAQPNINAPTICAIPIPLPDLSIQKAFTERVIGIESIQFQQSAATAKAQATFDALLAKVFDNRGTS